jgi:hypothetical protein
LVSVSSVPILASNTRLKCFNKDETLVELTILSRRMDKTVAPIKVKCGGEVVELKIYTADFQFVDFDRWLHARFHIVPDAKIVFRDREGNGETAHTAIKVYLFSDPMFFIQNAFQRRVSFCKTMS